MYLLRSDLQAFADFLQQISAGNWDLKQDGFAERAAESVSRHGGRIGSGCSWGTSTSGILSSEVVYRHRDPQTGRLPLRLLVTGRPTMLFGW